MDFESVKSAAAGRWQEIVERLTGLPQGVFHKGATDHPCPKCNGRSVIWPADDATTSGRIACRNCTQNRPTGDGIATVAAFAGIGQGEAAKLIADHLGLTTADHKPKDIDIIDDVCRAKKMPRDAFDRFGVKVATRGRDRAKVARVDVYNPEGQVHSHFDMTPTEKGKLKFGHGTSGMFFPRRLPVPGETWLIVEGVKDAAALTGMGFNAAGTNGSLLPVPFAKLFADCDIILVPDLDSAGQIGASRSGGHLSGIAKSVRVARLPGEVVEKGGDDVRDVIARHGDDAVREAIASATAWKPREGDPNEEDARPEVKLGLNWQWCVDTVVKHLGSFGWTPKTSAPRYERLKLYQRGGALVEVVEEGRSVVTSNKITLPEGTARIRALPIKQLPIRILSATRLVTVVEKRGWLEVVATPPPSWLVDGVFTAGDLSHVRPLDGIITAPTIRSDGSILQTAGYDNRSGLLFRPNAKFPPIPDNPTREDAKRAAAELLEVVRDFEFQSEHDKSAWVALVLSQIARQAVDGCVPLFSITATTRGSGKSLLCDAASLIAFGSAAARKTFTPDDDEMRKLITSVAMESLPALFIDNVDKPLGCASLDAVLTGTVWSDRVLGSSKTTGDLPMRTVWAATGNNIRFAGDTARRALPIRLVPTVENPEERSDFAHPNLLGWIRENRPRLAVAALTIVRAYFVAGRPEQSGGVWGSFESWSEIIRGATVWAGLADPLVTRETAKSDDASGAIVRGLVGGLLEVDEDKHGLTVREIVAKLSDDASGKRYPAMRDVIAEVATHRGQVDARKLGNLLKSYRGRLANGFSIQAKSAKGGVCRWFAGRSEGVEGWSGGSAVSLTHPLTHPIEPRNFVGEIDEGWSGGSESLSLTRGEINVCHIEGTCDTHISNGERLKTDQPDPPDPPSDPEPEPIADQAAKPKATRFPCERCGAKLVRLPETEVIDGWVNLDCPTRGCGHVKPVKVSSLSAGAVEDGTSNVQTPKPDQPATKPAATLQGQLGA